jgi:phosphomannomutase
MDLFGTAGIRGDVTTTVTPSLALEIGRALGADAAADDADVVIGRDGRTTGPGLAAAVESGVLAAGVDVTRVGVVPTPALAYASKGQYGAMLTASHNPPADNGIKLFDGGTEYTQTREDTIESRVAAESTPASWQTWGTTTHEEIISAYRDAVQTYASRYGERPSELTIAVDCGNGVGALATPPVLDRMGAEVITLNGNIDGHFPGRESKPTAASLTDIRTIVKNGSFDFGIGHDGDADRLVVIDQDGAVVHEDTILAILAAHLVSVSDVSDPVIVTTPNASGRIDEQVQTAGGRVERVQLGSLHEGITDAEIAGGDVVFAGEPWKHSHPALGGWIDAVASAAVLTRLIAEKGLPTLREPIRERPYRKKSVECPDENKTAVMEHLKQTATEEFPDAEITTKHGVRATFPDNAWTLIRPSGTEPYIRVYAEATPEAIDSLVDEVITTVSAAVDSIDDRSA